MYTRREIMEAWESHLAAVPVHVMFHGAFIVKRWEPAYFLDWLRFAGYLITDDDSATSEAAMLNIQQIKERPSSVEVGKVYRTPWEPSGLFRVTQIEPATGFFSEAAFGEFVGDHPSGYADCTNGRYFTKELEGREATTEELRPCSDTD